MCYSFFVSSSGSIAGSSITGSPLPTADFAGTENFIVQPIAFLQTPGQLFRLHL